MEITSEATETAFMENYNCLNKQYLTQKDHTLSPFLKWIKSILFYIQHPFQEFENDLQIWLLINYSCVKCSNAVYSTRNKLTQIVTDRKAFLTCNYSTDLFLLFGIHSGALVMFFLKPLPCCVHSFLSGAD